MRTHRYQITINGGLGEAGREAFADFGIESDGANIVLTGDLDQAAPVRRAGPHPGAGP